MSPVSALRPTSYLSYLAFNSHVVLRSEVTITWCSPMCTTISSFASPLLILDGVGGSLIFGSHIPLLDSLFKVTRVQAHLKADEVPLRLMAENDSKQKRSQTGNTKTGSYVSKMNILGRNFYFQNAPCEARNEVNIQPRRSYSGMYSDLLLIFTF
jgi:hypothetical protein